MFGFTFQDVAREFPQKISRFPEKNRVHLARILAEKVEQHLFIRSGGTGPRKKEEEIWFENQCGSHPH